MKNNKKIYTEILIESGKEISLNYKSETLNYNITKHINQENENKFVFFETNRNIVFDIDAQNYLSEQIATALQQFVPQNANNILIVGLGNNKLVADSLGVQTVNKIVPNLCKIVKTKYKLYILKAGVFGHTGIESATVTKALVQELNCDLVVAVDTLVAQTPERLGTSFQITNTGLTPGAGVNNPREKFNEEYLGVPVIVLGTPMVINALDICEDVQYKNLILSQKDTEMFVNSAARIWSLALNKYFNNLAPQEVADYFA